MSGKINDRNKCQCSQRLDKLNKINGSTLKLSHCYTVYSIFDVQLNYEFSNLYSSVMNVFQKHQNINAVLNSFLIAS